VTSPLTVNNKIDDDPTKPTDPGETGANSTSYMDGQISTWDNVGISGTTVDPDEQIDFGRNGSVTFNAAPGGFTDLVIAEVGGINPFILDICGDSSCSTYDRIFRGPSTFWENELIGMPEFASNDSGPASTLDQIWLFRFDEKVTDFIRIVEQDHRGTYTGARLQIDYIGTNAAISAVPVPAAVWLFGTALIGLVGFSKRKKAA
jgi:hypothetical protein